MYCRAAALAAGHSPEAINQMPLYELEALAVYAYSHGVSLLG